MDNDELENRILAIEKTQKTQSVLVPVKAAGVGIGMVALSGSTDLVSAGFVKMTIGKDVVYVPYFRKVE